MKLLIPALLAAAVLGCFAQSSSTSESAESPTTPSSATSSGDVTTTGGLPSSATSPVTGSNTGTTGTAETSGTAGTAETDATGATGNSESTTPAPTTTTTPLILTSFVVSNDLEPLDAKSILQHALQLDQQINQLNDYLKGAQTNTDPNNSPLFAQLTAFANNITAQNTTLQGYIAQLQTLNTTQSDIDRRVNSATDTFTCFSQSSCVTDVPTTAEPTTPGPTPSVYPCTSQSLKANSNSQNYKFDAQQNVAQCSITVDSSNANNYVNVMINVTIAGNAYLNVTEPRLQRTVTLNASTTNYNFTGFQEVEIAYFADPRGTIQFDFDYVEVVSCTLDCHSPNGTCKVSSSGAQYCECLKCQFTGDYCETPVNPCQAKQSRTCGETFKTDNAQTPYGTCYANPCYDQCYACECSEGYEDPDSPQTCVKPTDGKAPPAPPTPPTPSEIVCPTTAAPSTTTAAFLSSTIPSSGSSPQVSTSSTKLSSGATDSTSSTSSSQSPSDASSTSPDTSASASPSSSVSSTEPTSTVVPSTTTCTPGVGGCPEI